MKIYRGTPFELTERDAHLSKQDIERLFIIPALDALREDFYAQKLPKKCRIEFSYTIEDES